MKLAYVTVLRGIVLLLSIFINSALAVVGSSLSCKPVHCLVVAFITGEKNLNLKQSDFRKKIRSRSTDVLLGTGGT